MKIWAQAELASQGTDAVGSGWLTSQWGATVDRMRTARFPQRFWPCCSPIAQKATMPVGDAGPITRGQDVNPPFIPFCNGAADRTVDASSIDSSTQVFRVEYRKDNIRHDSAVAGLTTNKPPMGVMAAWSVGFFLRAMAERDLGNKAARRGSCSTLQTSNPPLAKVHPWGKEQHNPMRRAHAVASCRLSP